MPIRERSIFDKSIDIRLNVKTVLIALLIFILLYGVFALGRYAFPACNGTQSSATDVVAPSTTTQVEEETSESTVTKDDYICPDGTVVSEESECTVEEEEEAEEEVVEETNETEEEETTEETTTVETPEVVVYDLMEEDYSKVTSTFTSSGIYTVEPEDDYVKIMRFYLKITNEEEDAIELNEVSYKGTDYPAFKSITLDQPFRVDPGKSATLIVQNVDSNGKAISLMSYRDTSSINVEIRIFDADGDQVTDKLTKTFSI